jgi:hypothetical protein
VQWHNVDDNRCEVGHKVRRLFFISVFMLRIGSRCLGLTKTLHDIEEQDLIFYDALELLRVSVTVTWSGGKIKLMW